MRPRPILLCAAALTLGIATATASQSPSPPLPFGTTHYRTCISFTGPDIPMDLATFVDGVRAGSISVTRLGCDEASPAPTSSPSVTPDAIGSLTSDELVTLLHDRQPGDPPITVVAEASVRRDIPHGGLDCGPAMAASTCHFGVLGGSDGDRPEVVTADPVVAELYQRSGPSVEGMLGFTIDDDGLRFLGTVMPAPVGATWPVSADAMAAAADGVNAGQLVVVEGWLTVLGWGVPCPAPLPGIGGDPADSPFVRCPAGWILPDADLPDQGPGMTALRPSGFGIPVQYGAYQGFAPDPADPVDSMASPRQGTYLLRHVAQDGGPPTAWQVAGRLEPPD